MSTKTTLKRVALIAVAALGFGVLSVVPSNAAAIANCDATTGNEKIYGLTGYLMASGDTLEASTPAQDTYQKCNLDTSLTPDSGSPTMTGIAGPFNFVSVYYDADSLTAGQDAVITTTTSFVNKTGNVVIQSGATSAIAQDTDAGELHVATPTAGTVTVQYWVRTAGVLAASAAETVTITVLGTPVAATYASSTVADVTATDTTTGAGAYLASLNYRWQYTNSDGAVTRLANAAAPTNIPLYAFQISQLDALGGKLAAGSTKAMVLELSGVGSLSYGALNSGAGGNAAYIAVPATTANDRVVYLYADGRSGTTTLTISVNGVVVKTYTVIFWGSVSTYTMTVNNAHIQPGIATDALTVTAKDKNGVIVPKATVNLTSSSTATATVPATVVTGNGASFALTPSEFAGAGSVDIPVTGVAAGTVTVTAANATSSATVTATGSTMVTTKQVAGIDWKFDKSNYEIGERATVTFTLTGSDGKPVGDGTYNVFGTDPSSNKALTAGTLPSGTLDTLSGVASVKVNMPVSPGTVTLSAVLGTSTDLAAALRGVATSISAEVGSSSIDAVAEAAIEATDAANQAYEAAVVATETAEAAVAAAEEAKAAADAATAAVEALATEVAKLMAALKAQVTKLAATVAKILKLVK